MLIRLCLIQSALSVDDLVLAKKPPRVYAHYASHDSGRYLLLFPSERCHVDLDCSNPRSWSGRHVKRVPCAQHAVVHNEAIDRLTSWISIVVQALADGVGRSINREAVESPALAHRKIADDPPSFRNRIESAHHEGPQYHRRPLVDLESDLYRPRSQRLYDGIDGHSWIPPPAIKDYQPSPVVWKLIPVQTMFDRERKVEVTSCPRRGGRDDGFRELGVRESLVSLEDETHDLEVPALTFDVLRANIRHPEKCCEEPQCGIDPEANPGTAHSFSARAPGGCPGGSSRA